MRLLGVRRQIWWESPALLLKKEKSQNIQDTYETAPNSGGLYKNLVFKLTKDTPKILKYNDVITENKRVRAIGEDYDPAWYLDILKV